MLDEQLYLYNENSLDLLLRFTSSDQQDQENPSSDFFLHNFKEMPQTEDLLPLPFQLFEEQQPLPKIEPDAQVQKMREACGEQQAKVVKLLERPKSAHPKLVVSLKRKVSECTQAPTSPLRKTKMVKKEKQ